MLDLQYLCVSVISYCCWIKHHMLVVTCQDNESRQTFRPFALFKWQLKRTSLSVVWGGWIHCRQVPSSFMFMFTVMYNSKHCIKTKSTWLNFAMILFLLLLLFFRTYVLRQNMAGVAAWCISCFLFSFLFVQRVWPLAVAMCSLHCGQILSAPTNGYCLVVTYVTSWDASFESTI